MGCEIIPYVARKIEESDHSKRERLKVQLSRLEAVEAEKDAKVKLKIDIDVLRQKIKVFGEVPCA